MVELKRLLQQSEIHVKCSKLIVFHDGSDLNVQIIFSQHKRIKSSTSIYYENECTISDEEFPTTALTLRNRGESFSFVFELKFISRHNEAAMR